MGRLLKLIIGLLIGIFIGFVAFAYFGNLDPNITEIRQPVTLSDG
ncbi:MULTISPECIES: hypothetical protein [Halocynthiibacter]|uniref:Uncharacterized protein n=1 Tax=Halocynthiibacter halioticoli TaxID=2986804 RepID=A0AAE3J2V4_9RHOB|nr:MULTISPECIES: hypothetical protein [Halocynthiibacter]MCV6824297.1 hypothetical protein [Halocynthiibacter halioticoli]MCW4057298.1 hypothetical protein [Halocynthiibacter sp. SDUM655004]MDE0589664.1 hypothetical protein [Halocynthiibacter sp. C4]